MNKSCLPVGFAYVRDLVPDVVEQMRYAGEDNFVGRAVDGYLAPRAILTDAAARALKLVADDFRLQGYRLLIFDAYRPTTAVAHFMRWAADNSDTKTQEKYYPDVKSKEDILKKGYIAEKSGHSRGSTVDLTLATLAGDPLAMGTDFDWFGKRAAHGALDITPEETANRALLCRFMIAAGFRPYSEEWWHYALTEEPYPDTYFDFPVR